MKMNCGNVYLQFLFLHILKNLRVVVLAFVAFGQTVRLDHFVPLSFDALFRLMQCDAVSSSVLSATISVSH